VEILYPRRLNEVFNFVYKIELSIEGQQKKYKGVNRPQKLPKYPSDKRKFIQREA
jgi:hypothetical protein